MDAPLSKTSFSSISHENRAPQGGGIEPLLRLRER
jgi:hypothetical protein